MSLGSGKHDVWQMFMVGHWTDIASLETRGIAVPGEGLNISDRASPAKVVLRDAERRFLPVTYSLGLNIEARQSGTLKVTLAAWG